MDAQAKSDDDNGFVDLGFYDEKRDLLIGVTPDGVTKY